MKKKRLLWTILGMVLLCLVGATLVFVPHFLKIKKDFARLEGEEYNTVFLSMYPTERYLEEDYTFFRAMQTVRCDYEIPNGKVMRMYMDKINSSGRMVTTVYLGIDPERATKEDIVLMIQENPEIMFEVVPAYPQMNYWLGMKDEKCEEALAKYGQFMEWVVGLPNARIYFFSGQEWLICNKNNYEGTFMTNEAVSEFLMCNSDYLHPYMISAEKLESEIDHLRELIASYRNHPVEYPDAKEYDIVFLGDSIIGNYTDSMSIPEVVGALTGATVYNCGYGGKSAALGPTDDCPVSMIADALITGELTGLPKDHEMYENVSAFCNRQVPKDNLMFVINYGLNDYFRGYPVDAEDAYDITSFSGAMRMAVQSLQEAFPEALILLNTPNFTVFYEYGEIPQSTVGGKQSEYAEAVIRVAEEMQVEVLDNYRELPITEDNWQEYLSDGCHLNERGRFLVGSRIAQKIK